MDNVVDILKKVGAVITDSHFVYTSGKHGSVYVNKDAVYPHTAETSKIGELFAEKFKDMNIDIVAAPALGGIILSQWVAYHLSKLKGKEILGVYTVKLSGGNVVAVCVMVNREPGHVTSEVVGGPFSALGVLKASAFDEAD